MKRSPDWLAGYQQGLELAASEVETHWNESDRLCNQKEQAARSAAVLRRIATESVSFNSDSEIIPSSSHAIQSVATQQREAQM